jgi:RHS repeat-associated protein
MSVSVARATERASVLMPRASALPGVSYAFDAFGNRTSMTVGADETTYAYDDADRLTSVLSPQSSVLSYTWDDNGDLTARGSDSFSWDYEDRMVSATVNSVTTTFAYRGDGLRNSKTTGGNTTTFTWDVAAGLPVVLDDGNQYLYGAGLVAQKQSGNWYYYLSDGLGSTMKTVDSSGNVVNAYEYDIYGAKTSSSGSQSNEFDFAGQQTDGSTGLQYLRARYYDPGTGMFASRDPLSKMPGSTGSEFGYGDASPANMVDPSGLRTCTTDDDCGAGQNGTPRPTGNGWYEDWWNANIPHARGSEFRVNDNSIQWCSQVGCHTIRNGDSEYVKCATRAVGIRFKFECKNAFGGVLVSEYVNQSDSKAETEIEKALRYCLGGALSGPVVTALGILGTGAIPEDGPLLGAAAIYCTSGMLFDGIQALLGGPR